MSSRVPFSLQLLQHHEQPNHPTPHLNSPSREYRLDQKRTDDCRRIYLSYNYCLLRVRMFVVVRLVPDASFLRTYQDPETVEHVRSRNNMVFPRNIHRKITLSYPTNSLSRQLISTADKTGLTVAGYMFQFQFRPFQLDLAPPTSHIPQ